MVVGCWLLFVVVCCLLFVVCCLFVCLFVFVVVFVVVVVVVAVAAAVAAASVALQHDSTYLIAIFFLLRQTYTITVSISASILGSLRE